MAVSTEWVLQNAIVPKKNGSTKGANTIYTRDNRQAIDIILSVTYTLLPVKYYYRHHTHANVQHRRH